MDIFWDFFIFGVFGISERNFWDIFGYCGDFFNLGFFGGNFWDF